MITLELITTTGLKFAEEVHEVLVPTPEGLIAVYDNSSELVSVIDAGIISIRKRATDADEKMEIFATNGGVVEVTKHRIRLLVEEADASDEISAEQAQAALEKAQELVKSADSHLQLDQAMRELKTQQARLKIADLRRLKQRR